MAQTDTPGPGQHAFNPDAILGAFAQSSADAFKYASSPEKRNRLLDELLKRKDSLFEATLTYDELFRVALFDHLERTFPKNVATFQNSLAEQTIRALESFLSQFTASSFAEVHQEHQRVFLKIKQAFTGLESMTFSPPPSPIKEKGLGRHRKMSQQELKRAHVKQPSIDTKPFQILGIHPPGSLQEYEDIIERVMVTLKRILSDHIENMGKPEVLNHCVDFVISSTQAPSPSEGRKTYLDIQASPLASIMEDSTSLNPISPTSASQYFGDGVEEFGQWKLLLSTRCERDLRKAKRADAKRFAIIQKKIKELSWGFFSDDNQKKLTGPKTEIPVFEAKMEGDTRLVYTVDCVVDEICQYETQVLKLFGIYTHNKLEHGGLWDAVGQHLQRRGSDHRKRCLARQASRACNDYCVPQSFPPLPEIYEEAATPTDLDQTQLLKLHSILALEKFIPFTQTVLNNILADVDATHPFSVSYREQEIIRHKSSCFVLGRSGTGKTTTMLFKMFGIEQSSAVQKRRQVFITQSRVLVQRVQEYYVRLAQSLATGRKNQEETINIPQDTLAEKQLMELVEDNHSQARLPKKFCELTDDHFPLFVTFDKLCHLLEADLDLSFNRKAPTYEQQRVLRRFKLRRPKDVSMNFEGDLDENEQDNKEQLEVEEELKIEYHEFRSAYWPHFPQHLTKGLDPALVWSEFLGVICGSEASLDTPNGYVNYETYQRLSHRTQATFTSRRGAVYVLFQAYVKRKRELRTYDVADRTHSILRAIQIGGLPGPRFDFLYCDETQDNLLIDIKLMHALCKNPHGFFWAGDTAQQITSTAFRFADLKAFLFRLEETDQLVKLGTRKAVHPRPFSLSINYRSHGGIVNCAQTVIDTITCLWPNSIDVLERECGLVDGPRPIYFRNENDSAAHCEQFLFGETGSRVEFGAEQCILVRNDAARDELRTLIGDIGLIMTLYEAKGLEFSDVLLYNFFTDSPASKADWRVILNNLDIERRAGIAAPDFDELRHATVCSELKFLYVGLTRARNQLWIWDSSDRGEPMRILWDSRKQIDIRKVGDPIPKLAVSSTREEWAKTGRRLFSHGRYRQAERCFHRAGFTLERNISHAFLLREDARPLERRSQQRKLTFEAAAEAFWKCAEMDQGQRTRCYISSAECYVEADRLRRASDAYSYVEEWTLAARYARMAGEFDRALQIIKESQGVEEKVADSIIHVCKVVFARTEQIEKARALCETDEDLLGLMDDCNLEKTPVLEDLGRYIEAGELRAVAGDTIDAIRLFILGGSQERAAQCLCDAFWEQMPYGTTVTDLNAERVRALEEVSTEINVATPQLKNELDMFRALIAGDGIALGVLSEVFCGGDGARQEAAALRSLDYLSRQKQEIDSMTFEEVDQLQTRVHLFGTRFRKLSRGRDLQTSASVQRLFGFKLDDTGLEATVSPSSCIPTLASQELSMKGSNEGGGLVVNAQELGFWIVKSVSQRLVSVLSHYGEACLQSKPFSNLCYPYLEGWRLDCGCTQLHCRKEEVPQFYNKQVRLYLKQLHVLSQGEPSGPDRGNQRNNYLRRIFEIIFPLHDATGNLITITSDSVPSEGLIVLRQWVQDRTVHLDVKNPTAMLRMLIMASTLDIYRTPNLRRGNTINRLRKDHNGYRGSQPLLLDLINSLFKLAKGGIVQGIGFLRHIISYRVSIDLQVLVVYLEILTAIILRCLRPDNADGVILPRSFLMQFVQRRRPPQFDCSELEPLFSPLQRLVKSIHLGDGTLRVENQRLDKAQIVIRSLLISRIFRCLVLIGCNSGDPKVQHQIGLSITALGRNRGSGEISYFYSRYIQAQKWEDLVTAAYESFHGSTVDHMVCLVQTSKQYSNQLGKGLVSLPFKNEAGLFATFSSSLPIIRKPTFLTAAPSFIPESTHEVESRSHPSEVMSIVDSEDRAITTSLLSVEDMRGPIPEEEIRAARAIQRAFRKACRRTAIKKTDEVFTKRYRECVEVRNTLSGPRTYQMYFLGPLPHVLVWADAVVRCLKSRGDNVRAKFKTICHTEIEELNDHLNVCSDHHKRAIQLQKRLLPNSEVHRRCQLQELKKLVSRLEKMTLELEIDLDGAEEHRYLGRKGILQEKSPVIKYAGSI